VMLGVFLAFDVLLFYIFFELTLVPLFFLIGIWGGAERRYAARKFFIFTLAGSLITFLGILAIVLAVYLKSSNHELTFSIPRLVELIPTMMSADPAFWKSFQIWVFLALFAGFAIKVPLFPLHTWLPLAHVEAPTAGSVLLAGVLLKMGTYGFLRLALPLVPDACITLGVPLIGTLSVIGIIYGAFCSLAQDDIKKLIAYSSVSHLGFCTLGIIALNPAGISGSILQQINHGISTGMLFLVVGVVYERRHTREISEYGGLLKVMPIFTLIFGIAALSSMGMPPLNGFIGELTIMGGAYQMSFNWAFWGAVGIALGAAYLLWLFQRTMLGEVKDKNSLLKDLSWREIAVFTPLIVWAFWIGLNPQPYFRILERPVAKIVERVRPGYYAERHLVNPLDATTPLPSAALR